VTAHQSFYKNKYFFNETVTPSNNNISIVFGPFVYKTARQTLAWYDSKLRTSYFNKALKKSFDTIPKFMGFLSSYYNMTVSFKDSKPLAIKIIPAVSKKEADKKGIYFKLYLKPQLTSSFNVFIGPNNKELLDEIGASELISYGFFSSIAQVLLKALKFFYGFTHDWGISIILLTFLIKLLLHPLTVKQARSANEMKKIQPIINSIKEKYKNEPNKLNTEMMKVYKDHNVNPLGGCLPVLVQIPILFALFTVLRVSIALKGESFLWISDLAAPDKTLILPILVALSMYFQQKTMPTMDQNQKTMMAFMPVMMFFFARALASGVVLYWFVSTLLGVFEQYRIMNPQPTTTGSNSNHKGDTGNDRSKRKNS
jgi:YidC/Oxa1 family membrane protein insertase